MILLILEDEEFFLKYHEKLIAHHVEKTFECKTISKALETIQKEHIDICFIDLSLENENGMDFLKKIRDLGHNQRAIICSSHISKEVKKEAALYGVVDFVKKPFDLSDILVALCVDK